MLYVTRHKIIRVQCEWTNHLSLRKAVTMRRPNKNPWLMVTCGIWFCMCGQAQDLPTVDGVESQPLKAQVKRLTSALELLGEPLTGSQQAALEAAIRACLDEPVAG